MSDSMKRLGDLEDGTIISYKIGNEVRKYSLLHCDDGMVRLVDTEMMKPFYDACILADTLQSDILESFKSRGCKFYTRKYLNETFGNYSWWLDATPYTIPGILIGGDKYPDKIVEDISTELTGKLEGYQLHAIRVSGYQVRLIRKKLNLLKSEIPYGIRIREFNSIY